MAKNEYTVIAGDEFKRVVAALKEIDSRMVSEFRKSIRREVEPYRRKAQDNILRMPVKHVRRTKKGRIMKAVPRGALRAKIAAGVTISTRLSRNASITVETHTPVPGGAIIPRGFDSAKGWRHPVFGQDVWVQQTALKPGWFLDTLADAKEPIKGGLRHILDDAAKKVAESGGGPA